jgi:hypothetical protein
MNHLGLDDVEISAPKSSVSRFQEKEKRGEMIPKNDNIKW